MFSVFKGTVKGRKLKKGFASLELRFCLFVCFVFSFSSRADFLSLGARFEERLHGALELKKNEIEGPLPNVFNCPLSFSLSVTSNRRGPWERDCAKY